jgi:hypothetical protein
MIMENLNMLTVLKCCISSDSGHGSEYCWQWLSRWAGTKYQRSGV